jgi:hypothetical protein
MKKSYDFVVRAHYDAKQDTINLTADPKLHAEMAAQGFRISLNRDTPSEKIVRRELQRTGIIPNPHGPRPAFTFDEAVRTEFITSRQLKLLKLLLDSKRNLLVYGPMGGGKTMLLSAMLNYLDDQGVEHLNYVTRLANSPSLTPTSRVTQIQLTKLDPNPGEAFGNLLKTVLRQGYVGALAIDNAEPEHMEILNQMQVPDGFHLVTVNSQPIDPLKLEGSDKIFSEDFQDYLNDGFYGAVIYLHRRHHGSNITIELL